MAFSPGRNVGRVSIRVVPDTTRFRPDLKRKLETIERTTTMTVKVDEAKVDRTKFRESLRRQLAEFDDVDIATNIAVTVDKAKIRRGALRKSIQEQFDKMSDVRVWIAPGIRDQDQARFHREVEHMVDSAKSRIDVGVNAHTLDASAQIRYVTRPRYIDIILRVSKASIASVTTTLAALSGARLTWQWMDDLIQMGRNLDKTLPSIVMWTSSITALIAALAGSVSGLVGIGQGLFSITPAFLVLPGLILNAVGSLTVLFVALKHAKDELSDLSGGMNELGGIIRTTFWDNARQPILDLVNGLMPQLRNAFRDLSTGVGEFTGALADSFGRELAGGRLESIFAGIAEGWRVLGTGADGFAGALVSLSQIAARYTPRLAGWFVRQANTFDAWLESIANDGRLESWMEGAIDSMYDLWDATTGTAGVLANIWKAADQAGSGGLKGFADMMQEWQRVTGTVRFQRGLEAVFRGSYVAMDAFGGAIGSLGDLIADMPDQFERFVGSVGGFIGGLFDEAFQALNNTSVRIGLDGLSSGLDAALAGIAPNLQPIADTFGGFLGLLGDLARNLLPAAAGAFANLMPAVDALVGAIEPVLPTLADAVLDISASLGPALEDFVTAASPLFRQVVSDLATALVELTPVVSQLVSVLADVVGALSGWAKNNEGFFDGLKRAMTPDSDEWKFDLEDAMGGKVRNENGFLLQWFNDANKEDALVQARHWGDAIGTEFRETLRNKGPEAAQQFLDGLNSVDMPAALREDLEGRFGEDFQGAMRESGRQGGGSFGNGLGDGFGQTLPGLGTTLNAGGAQAMEMLRQGVEGGKRPVMDVFNSLPPEIRAQIPTGFLFSVGWDISQGLANGINANRFAAIRAAESLANDIPAAAKNVLKIASPSRRMRDEVGKWIPAGVAAGIDKHKHLVDASARAMADFDVFGGGDGSGPAFGSGGNQVNVTMPLLPGETPQEQRDNLVKELQWAF